MKVVYDISLLGIGNTDPHVRTGAYRYIENLAYELARSSECELSFCALRPWLHINSSSYALDYLQGSQRLNRVPFLAPPLITVKRLLDHQISRASDQIKDINNTWLKRLSLKAVRRSLNLSRRALDRTPDFRLSKNLANVDVLHSPSNFPLPSQVRQDKHVKRFVTIYDLSPILYPQLFDFDAGSLLGATIRSIEHDGWAICISHATRNDLLNHFNTIDPSRAIVTHLAASDIFYPCDDTERVARVQSKYGIPGGMRYLLSVGTLEPRKNLETVIDSFSRFVKQNQVKDLNLVLVGAKGWKYDKIFSRVSQEDWLRERIMFTGYVPDDDLAPLYKGALAFVYLSLYEGFGLPPLEAMQCGVPVIVSNTSAFPEVIGEAGLLIDPTDRDAICQAMYRIYESATVRESLSRRSLERARQFSWEQCMRGTLNAYKTALSN